MKKLILTVGAIQAFASYGQTFADNFDSYTAGQALGPQSSGAWTTWSGTTGGTEDVLVSSADAASAPNSLFFSTTAQTGGPTDLIRNFGVLNSGQFSMEFNIKVQTGKAGYFNFQKTATPGQAWAMDCFFNDNGTLLINNQEGLTFNGTYTQNVWFNFRIDINFNTNTWEVFINDASIGSFSNPINQIASIDIYPTDQTSPYSCGYYIDDFAYTITPFTPSGTNAAATGITYAQGNLAGAAVTPKVKVRNLGTAAITSFNLAVTYNGNTINKPVTGVNIASMGETEVTMDNTLTLIAGANNMVATVSNVNGNGADNVPGDDVKTVSINPTVPAPGKMVVGEEATGTWCGWCPRGAVFMDMMEAKYGNFWAGIAVHNNDPMVVAEYDAFMGTQISGYPKALVDRTNSIDPSAMESPFLSRVMVAPKATIENGATWDAGTRKLVVSTSATFTASANNNYKLAIVLTEDGVTGSTSGYNQTNYYAGGAQGVMGGYEALPSPVPAAQMVYDHVARAIEPSPAGYASSFPTTVNAGETYTIRATFTLPAGWDEDEIHIIGLLIDPAGDIDNAGKATIDEAIDNGLEDGTDVTTLGVTKLDQPDDLLSVYPNPASDKATIAINLASESEITVRIVEMSGKVAASRNYGKLSGSSTVEFNTAAFADGVYTVEVITEGGVAQQRLVIKK